MKSLVYHGPMDVRIDDKPKPRIQDKEDITLKVTSTAICGSDLHLYHGNVLGMQPGQTLGHEFMGIVEEVGSSVQEVKVGDRVVIPFNISCGHCSSCNKGSWSQCDRSNPNGELGGTFGYTQLLGGYDGGQAEYVRVPFANTEALKVPDIISRDEQVLFLSDILPTGYFRADIANVQPGDDVAVFGAGPVGYFAVMSSFLKGAARVFCIDHWPNRLSKTKELGAEIINFDNVDPVEILKKETNKKGVICIDAVGYEAVGHMAGNICSREGDMFKVNNNNNKKEDSKKKEGNQIGPYHSHEGISNPGYEPSNPLQVITWMTQVAKKNSIVSIPGVYGSTYDQFPLGLFFNRGIQIHMGQCPVKKYNEQLLHLIETGRLDATKIISHNTKLEDAPKAYEMFNNDKDNATKIVLKP